jgi:signal peptidase I
MMEEKTMIGSATDADTVSKTETANGVPVGTEAHRAQRMHMPTLAEAMASLLVLLVVTLFLHTFVLQPFLIPSESMERTLLVGDFLLFNKQVYAPSDWLSRALLPYREVERGDIVVFHHPNPHPILVKRVVGLPGDRLHIENGRLTLNGQSLEEPYATFEPVPFNVFGEYFPGKVYTNPEVDPDWWKQMQSLTRNGELVIPAGKYFVLGDNRNHSIDSRFWGFVSKDEIVARPLVIYFSVSRPSSTDVQQVADDRLGHGGELTTGLASRLTGFARWKRIFRVVH